MDSGVLTGDSDKEERFLGQRELREGYRTMRCNLSLICMGDCDPENATHQRPSRRRRRAFAHSNMQPSRAPRSLHFPSRRTVCAVQFLVRRVCRDS